MKLLAIDPGPVESALVTYDLDRRAPRVWSKLANAQVLIALDHTDAVELAVEMVASYGMAVGAEVFETCVWAGRFIERWNVDLGSLRGPREHHLRVFRRDVKLHLCGSSRAKDANVRQALIDRYGPGKERAVGRKASPGPLYGMKADCWQALGVAVTAAETMLAETAAA